MSDTADHPTAKKMRDEIERSKAALEMVGKDREHCERELERCLAEIARLQARVAELEKGLETAAQRFDYLAAGHPAASAIAGRWEAIYRIKKTVKISHAALDMSTAFRRLHESSRSRDGELCLDFQKVRAQIEQHFKKIGVGL